MSRPYRCWQRGSKLPAFWLKTGQPLSERLGDVLTGADVCVRASQIHGVGLFAARPIEAGEIVALHPVHRVLKCLMTAASQGHVVDEADRRTSGPRPARSNRTNSHTVRSRIDRRTATSTRNARSASYWTPTPQRRTWSGGWPIDATMARRSRQVRLVTISSGTTSEVMRHATAA